MTISCSWWFISNCHLPANNCPPSLAGRQAGRGARTVRQDASERVNFFSDKRLLFVVLCLSCAGFKGSPGGPGIHRNSSSVALFVRAVKEGATVSLWGGGGTAGGRNYLPVHGDDEENLGNDPEGRVLGGGRRDWDVNKDHRPLIRR